MRKFGRKTGQRRAFKKSLASNLIMQERIETTSARAKELRPMVEKMITTAKKNDLASLRTLLSQLPKQSATKMYYEIAPRYKDRKGGYTRILKTEKRRKRDGVELSVIEFV